LLAHSDIHDGKIGKKDISPLLLKTKNFDIISKDRSNYLSGHASSVGYEGFSTGWHSLIIQLMNN